MTYLLLDFFLVRGAAAQVHAKFPDACEFVADVAPLSAGGKAVADSLTLGGLLADAAHLKRELGAVRREVGAASRCASLRASQLLATYGGPPY